MHALILLEVCVLEGRLMEFRVFLEVQLYTEPFRGWKVSPITLPSCANDASEVSVFEGIYKKGKKQFLLCGKIKLVFM